jgi:uncharacterized protein (TIGR01244 family)
MGVGLVINNRPDGEEPGQPEAAGMARAAHGLDIDYLYAPVSGMPNAQAVEAVEAALNDGTPVLMHCKSGMRSTVAWALAAARRTFLSGSTLWTPGQEPPAPDKILIQEDSADYDH